MKALRGILEVVVFLVIYELALFIINWGGTLIFAKLSTIPVLNLIFNGWVLEGIIYTVLPIASVFVIAYLMAIIFKKINIISYIVMMCFVAFAVVSTIINNLKYYGLFSWTTANIVWSNVIIIGSLGYLLFNLTGYKLKKEE